MNQKEIEFYDTLVQFGIATEQEIKLVRDIMSGSWNEILEAILYARTGFRHLDSYLEEIQE